MQASADPPAAAANLTRLVVATCALGFASGLPNVLLTDTLSAWLSDAGFVPTDIGLLAVLAFPYGLKFLWAPVLDRFRAPGFGWLGLRRGWIALLSLLLVAALAWLAISGPSAGGGPLAPIVVSGLVAAALSASLDAAVDAHRTDAAASGPIGPSAAAYVLGYRVAFVVVGALLLVMHRRVALLFGPPDDPVAAASAWKVCVAAGGSSMLLGALAAAFAPEPAAHASPATITDAVVAPVRSFASRFGSRFLAVAFVALCFRLPDLLGNRMTMPFLRQRMGFVLEDIGWVRQGLGFTMTIAGALVGGIVVQRIGLFRALLLFGVLQVASNAGYLVLGAAGPSMPVFAGVVVVENLCNGLVSSAFVAYFMSLCEPRLAAAQYAILSGLMYLSGTIVGTVSGYLVDRLGYPGFFTVSILVGVPPLLVLPWAMPLPDDSRIPRARTD